MNDYLKKELSTFGKKLWHEERASNATFGQAMAPSLSFDMLLMLIKFGCLGILAGFIHFSCVLAFKIMSNAGQRNFPIFIFFFRLLPSPLQFGFCMCVCQGLENEETLVNAIYNASRPQDEISDLKHF